MQNEYDLTISLLLYGNAILYMGQEERLKQRYVQSMQRYNVILHNVASRVCLEANGRMRCFLCACEQRAC